MADTKATFRLDQIQIASPCKVAWESMQGGDVQRHCSQCNLHVYNVASLSRVEAESLIERGEGKLCVRLYKRADGTVITADCPVGLAAIRRRIVAWTASLVAGVAVAVTAVGMFAVPSSGGQRQNSSQRFQKLRNWVMSFIDPPSQVVMGDVCVSPPPVPQPQPVEEPPEVEEVER